MARKIIKAEYGVEIQEDTETGRLYMLLDGYSVFTAGIPKDLKRFVDKSYDNMINIRKNEKHDN